MVLREKADNASVVEQAAEVADHDHQVEHALLIQLGLVCCSNFGTRDDNSAGKSVAIDSRLFAHHPPCLTRTLTSSIPQPCADVGLRRGVLRQQSSQRRSQFVTAIPESFQGMAIESTHFIPPFRLA